jgi:hypothetical protein
MIFHYSSASFYTTEKKDKNRETDLKKQEGVVEFTGSHLSLSSVPCGVELAHIRGYT